jgi:hypothetical protein
MSFEPLPASARGHGWGRLTSTLLAGPLHHPGLEDARAVKLRLAASSSSRLLLRLMSFFLTLLLTWLTARRSSSQAQAERSSTVVWCLNKWGMVPE